MRFGVNILNFGPGATPDNLARWAQIAEALGYAFVMISDHVAVTPDVQAQYPAPFYDPFIVLAWLAASTKKLELGTTVAILPYRHPLHTARMVANIDQLSGGRFILGVGVGWARQEFETLGVPFSRRGALANEYLAAIRDFWTHDVITWQGVEVHTAPRPLRPPPIWVGGSSEAAMGRAVRYGDAWHPLRFRTPWLIEKGLPLLRQIAEREQSHAPALCPRINLRLAASPLDEATRFAGQGTIDQVRADIDTLRELDATHVLFDTYSGLPADTASPEKDWEMLAKIAAG